MNKKIRDDYRDLCMMRDAIAGEDMQTIAMAWGCTVRTASSRIRRTASEMMRQAMEQTQGDPDHPASSRFTLEEFTADPRGAMVAIMRGHIETIERDYPILKDITKPPK